MIKIHKQLLYELFDKNIDLYFKFMNTIKIEYMNTINELKLSNTVNEIRFNVHKLISIISNLTITEISEILFLCKALLLIDKSYPIDYYFSCVDNIIDFDKTTIGL
jgi:hypothetical protein